MGISGIIAQIVLLRELLITFLGNELSIGMILANWLILESAGAFLLGKRIDRAKNKIKTFIAVTLLFSISFPTAVYLSRTVRAFGTSVPGETVGIAVIFFSSLLVLLPASLTHGSLFTFACKLRETLPEPGIKSELSASRSIGRVYMYETAGTLLGGVLLTFFLIPRMGSFQIAYLLGSLNIFACALLAISFLENKSLSERVKAYGPGSLLLAVFAFLLLTPAGRSVDQTSLSQRWPGQNVVHYRNTIYGNIAVTELHGQYNFFYDGIPVITFPVPDISAIEEFVHLPMLFHENPNSILFLGGGAGGAITEALKHEPEVIDYVELDPAMIQTVERFASALTHKELSHPRVNVKHLDGKTFVQKTTRQYDIVLIGFDDPSNLQVNRLFTKEFFELLKERMSPEGIVALRLPGSLAYMSEQMRDLNACILNSLRTAFGNTRVIPGDGTNILMASPSQNLVITDEELLTERFVERAADTLLISPHHIRYKLDQERASSFDQALRGATDRINTDFRPVGTFFSLAFGNSMLTPGLRPVFRTIQKANAGYFILAFMLGGAIFAVALRYSKNPLRLSVPLSIASTGFAGMFFDLAIIFAFQITYGYVFHWLGLLVSIFMTGALLGSLWMTNVLASLRKKTAVFAASEAAVMLFALALPAALTWRGGQLPQTEALTKSVFLAASLISGLTVGTQFPLANNLFLSRGTPNSTESASALYASDLLGGWFSGMIAGVVMIPVMGLLWSCVVIASLKAVSLLLLGLSLKIAPRPARA